MDPTKNKFILQMAGMFRDTDNNDELDLFYRLSNQKAPDGSKLFNPLDIGNIDISFDEDLLKYKDIITNILNSPSKLEEISKREIGHRGPEFVALCTKEMDKQKEEQKQANPTEHSSVKDTVKAAKMAGGGVDRMTIDSVKSFKERSEMRRIERDTVPAYSSLNMDVSRVLAKASVEILGEKTKKHVIEYFKNAEKMFKTHDFTAYDAWTRYAVAEYDKLNHAGIINEKGNILDVKKFLASPLIQDTPDTFHAAGFSSVKLANAPTIKQMQGGQGPNDGQGPNIAVLKGHGGRG